jgi:hypothetical protein
MSDDMSSLWMSKSTFISPALRNELSQMMKAAHSSLHYDFPRYCLAKIARMHMAVGNPIPRFRLRVSSPPYSPEPHVAHNTTRDAYRRFLFSSSLSLSAPVKHPVKLSLSQNISPPQYPGIHLVRLTLPCMCNDA